MAQAYAANECYKTDAPVMGACGKPYPEKVQRLARLGGIIRKVSTFDPDGNIGAREMIVVRR